MQKTGCVDDSVNTVCAELSELRDSRHKHRSQQRADLQAQEGLMSERVLWLQCLRCDLGYCDGHFPLFSKDLQTKQWTDSHRKHSASPSVISGSYMEIILVTLLRTILLTKLLAGGPVSCRVFLSHRGPHTFTQRRNSAAWASVRWRAANYQLFSLQIHHLGDKKPENHDKRHKDFPSSHLNCFVWANITAG